MPPEPSRAGPTYPWTLVGLLWFCGFFNYADRQAIFSVFPVLKDQFALSNAQLGLIGSAFMVVYALMAPLSGYVVDRAPRRWLIVFGLGFWSIICAATALATRFWQLLLFRAAEGLGESFYFPASMSILADYHGRGTRSRAMSLHQTSVYAGTVGGGCLAGLLGERYGWQSPFWILGTVGFIYAFFLVRWVVEPVRGKADLHVAADTGDDAVGPPESRASLAYKLGQIVRVPSACALLAAFAGANFVAAVMLTWLPQFIYSHYGQGLASASVIANLFHLASLGGAVFGGPVADLAARRVGGRMRVQAVSLLAGAPCVFLAGGTGQLPVLMLALLAAGFCKGCYDANIFASIYDVVPTSVRGTAAGLMNTLGWAFASTAPVAIGRAIDRYGLSAAIASTSAVYVAAGLLALLAAALAQGQQKRGK